MPQFHLQGSFTSFMQKEIFEQPESVVGGLYHCNDTQIYHYKTYKKQGILFDKIKTYADEYNFFYKTSR